MKKLTLENFEELLDSRNRAEPVLIVTSTLQGRNQMNSGGRRDKDTGEYPNPFYENVYRIAERNVFIGCNYESCVNRQRERELQPLLIDGSLEYFHADQLWNGKGIMLNKYIAQHIDHGELYIGYKPLVKDGYVANKASAYYWCHNNKKLTPAQEKKMKQWMKPQRDNEKQGTDVKVEWRTLTLCNLKRITINGQIYDIDIASQKV